MEVRYLAHAKQTMALELIPQIAADFERSFGRSSGGLLHGYRCEDAHTIVVALGSVLGTIKDTVDALRDAGHRIGVLGITSFRPFPLAAVREGLLHAERVIVLEKSFSVGLGGILANDVRMAMSGTRRHGYTVVAGLGGRAITQASLAKVFEQAMRDEIEPLTFLDMDWGLIERQLERERRSERSGPAAEAMLRDLGAVASRVS